REDLVPRPRRPEVGPHQRGATREDRLRRRRFEHHRELLDLAAHPRIHPPHSRQRDVRSEPTLVPRHTQGLAHSYVPAFELTTKIAPPTSGPLSPHGERAGVRVSSDREARGHDDRYCCSRSSSEISTSPRSREAM